MSRLVLPLVAVAATLAGAANAEPPLHATVNSQSAEVRSGPGNDYYVTAKLSQGAPVEIYRMLDGWCGIRPLESSFSYVLAEHVQPSTSHDQVLVTRVGNARTRVGSQLSARHNVKYITLKQGELLKQIGDAVVLGTPSRRWYRIAPPAGEFRWVKLADLAVETTAGSAATPPTVASVATPPKPQQDATTETTVQTEHAHPPATKEKAAEAIKSIVAAAPAPNSSMERQHLAQRSPMRTVPIPIATAETVTELPGAQTVQPTETPRDTSGAWVVVGTSDVPRAMSPPTPTPMPTPMPTPTPMPASTQAVALPAPRSLPELELALSQTVTRETDQWELASLGREARQLARQSPDAATQSGVDRLLVRIAEFAEVKRRHEDLVVPPQVMPAPSPPSPVVQAAASQPVVPNQSLAAANRRTMPTRTRTDVRARGWLVPVVSSRPAAPRYALTNDDGDILYFVTDRRRERLGQHANQSVVITGQLADAGQLMAEHISRYLPRESNAAHRANVSRLPNASRGSNRAVAPKRLRFGSHSGWTR